MDILLVLTTLPDRAQAEALGTALVDARHAACATVLPGARSIYRWQGVVETADEALLLCKTTDVAYAGLAAAIRAAHSYQVPQIVALPISYANSDYADWVRANLDAG